MSDKITINYSYTYPFINDTDITSYKDKVIDAMNTLLNKSGEGNDFLSWLELPDKILSSKDLNRILETGNEIYKNADLLICIGIGGSYLGAKAVTEALIHPLHNILAKDDRNGPRILFAGHNINGKWLEAILTEMDKTKSIYINVISKSGTTTEPGIAFRIIKQKMEKKIWQN